MTNQVKSKRLKDARNHGARTHFEAYTWDKNKNPLPKPLLCAGSICRASVKPTCATMIQPQYNPMASLTKALVGIIPSHFLCIVQLYYFVTHAE